MKIQQKHKTEIEYFLYVLYFIIMAFQTFNREINLEQSVKTSKNKIKNNEKLFIFNDTLLMGVCSVAYSMLKYKNSKERIQFRPHIS